MSQAPKIGTERKEEWTVGLALMFSLAFGACGFTVLYGIYVLVSEVRR